MFSFFTDDETDSSPASSSAMIPVASARRAASISVTSVSSAATFAASAATSASSAATSATSVTSAATSAPIIKTRSTTSIHLWQFVKELLLQPQLYSASIHWLDRGAGIFKIVDSNRVATLWGKRKNRPAMNYDKLSRSLRQYYKKGIMKKTERTQRLVYQFCHPYHL